MMQSGLHTVPQQTTSERHAASPTLHAAPTSATIRAARAIDAAGHEKWALNRLRSSICRRSLGRRVEPAGTARIGDRFAETAPCVKTV
jgi:hypothetical protein